MKDYNKMDSLWVPYVMFINEPNMHLKSFNTDHFGFRYTHNGNERVKYDDFKNTKCNKSLICGGSTTFGIGATSDNCTIPSILNEHTDSTWFNFGGRAYNSTQELLLFLLHKPDVDNIVLFSGLNYITVGALSTNYNSVYESFFNEHIYYKGIKLAKEYSVRFRLYKLLRSMSQTCKKIKSEEQATQNKTKYEDTLDIISRDLDIWSALSDSMGFSFKFVLQPFPSWSSKVLSSNEEKLFKILDDSGSTHWQVLKSQLDTYYPNYSFDLEKICEKRKIPYLDSNKYFSENEWLFVDRAHLTDAGNLKIVDILLQEGIV